MRQNNTARIGRPGTETAYERMDVPARFTVERGEKTGVIAGPGEAWTAETDKGRLTHGKMKIRVWENAGERK